MIGYKQVINNILVVVESLQTKQLTNDDEIEFLLLIYPVFLFIC